MVDAARVFRPAHLSLLSADRAEAFASRTTPWSCRSFADRVRGVDEDAFDAGIDCTRCNDRVGRERVRQDGGEHCCKSTPSGRGAQWGRIDLN